ncbi:STAS-like domain-containing protein [Lascolabacillus massiliensis]|jgi:hypothetical protein|uniref:STAS-like domain-containing protein n=1 Tax=Lascolabacillus massiliensis TaxID=1627894 RepID=UPI0006B355FF|nr:DUF4325 domain-containing protein [Lascolabacillus massiliensis]
MRTIRIKAQVKGTSTNDEGCTLKYLLFPFFENNESVIVSFKDTTPMSSSFFNSSFGELIDEFGYDSFKNIVLPRDITASHLKLIKMYIDMHRQNETA